MDSLFSPGMSSVIIAQITSLLMVLIPQGLVLVGIVIWFKKVKSGWGIALLFFALMSILFSIGNTFLTISYIHRMSFSEIDVLNVMRIVLSALTFLNNLLFAGTFIMMALNSNKKTEK